MNRLQEKLVRDRHPIGGFAFTHPAFNSTANLASFIKKIYLKNVSGIMMSFHLLLETMF